MNNYIETCQYLKSNNYIKNDHSFFDFSLTKNIDEWTMYSEFFARALKNDELRTGEKNTYFYFSNLLTPDASCYKVKDHFLVNISMVYFRNIISNTIDRSDEINRIDEIKQMEHYFVKCETTIPYFLKDIAILTVFYHEYSHVKHLQIENNINLSFSETPETRFELKKHLYELDADGYSTHCISMRIINLIKRSFSSYNHNTVRPFIVLACFSIIASLHFQYPENFNKVYLFEKSHPCTPVRITKYIQGIIGNVLLNLNVNMSEYELISETVRVCKILSKELLKIDLINEVATSTASNASELKNYFDEIDNLSKQFNNLHSYNIARI